MTRVPSTTLPAPGGMDATADPLALPLNRAQSLVNVTHDKEGVIRANVSMTDVLPAPLATFPDGQGYFYGDRTASDRLLYVTNGLLYESMYSGLNLSNSAIYYPVGNAPYPQFPVPYPPLFAAGNPVTNGNGFVVNARTRMVQYKDEVVITQDQNIVTLAGVNLGSPYMYKNDGQDRVGLPGIMWNLGLNPPAAPAVVVNAGGAKTVGEITYKTTYVDYKLRESSPSAGTTVTLTGGNQQTTVTISFTGNLGGQIRHVYLYVNLAGPTGTGGGPQWFRIATFDNPINAANTYTFNDNLSDATVSTGALAPNPGENDRPNPASIAAVHRNHVVLNDLTDPQGIQISNLDSPTQYTSIPTLTANGLPILTDGLRTRIATAQGDQVKALVSYGPTLFIFKRSSVHALQGDTIADFVIRGVNYSLGCISTDSAVLTPYGIMFLAEDGVYLMDGGGGVTKISKPIEGLLFAQKYTAAGWQGLENSCAVCDNRYYYLFVQATSTSGRIFAYSFESQGWSIIGMGVPPYAFNLSQGLIPGIIPGVGPPPSGIPPPGIVVGPPNPNPGPPPGGVGGGGSFQCQCLAPETTVLLKNGCVTRVGNLMPGMEVLSLPGHCSAKEGEISEEVKRVDYVPGEPRLRIVAGRFVITCSHTHLFCTGRGKLDVKRAYAVRPGDTILSIEGDVAVESVEEVESGPVIRLELSGPTHTYLAGGIYHHNSKCSDILSGSAT